MDPPGICHYSEGGSSRHAPLRLSASFTRTSNWAFALRSSAAATRLTASSIFGSMRSGYATRSGPGGLPRPIRSAVQGAGVDDRGRVLVANHDDHQIGCHGCLALVVEIEAIGR